MQITNTKLRNGMPAKAFVVSGDSEAFELSESGEGFCISCGESQYGCEPDARKYTCESCGEPKVYGFDELVLRGFVRFE